MKNNIDIFKTEIMQSTHNFLENMAVKKIVIDNYLLLEEIGQGGMGIVYKAKEKQTEEIVAIKFLLHYDNACQNKATKVRLQRFVKEAKIGQRLHHPNIVHIHKLGYYNNSPYIVMDYIEGITLLKYIQQPHIIEQWTIYGNIFYQLSDALHYIHTNNIVHRDIKPENIIINQQGNPILMDFGIARNPLEQSNLTNTNIILGTPLYISPEQIKGEKATSQSDIYQLGTVFYHVLTNTPPYYGQTTYEILTKLNQEKAKPPQAFNPNIPIELENIVLKAIEKNTSRRYKTAQEMAQDLKKYLQIYDLFKQKSEPSQSKNNIEPKKFIKKRRTTKKYLKKNRSNQNIILTQKIFIYTLLALLIFLLYFIFDSNKIHNRTAENTNKSIYNEPTHNAENNIIAENTNKSIYNESTNTTKIQTQTEQAPSNNLLIKKTTIKQPKTNQTPMDSHMEKLFQHLENNDQFQYLGTQTYTCGERTNTMHEYKHIQTGMELVLLPSGFYFSSLNKQNIFIRSFLIAKYECTQKIWNLIVPDLPKQYITKFPQLKIGDEYPIAGQTYSDSYEFCKRTGLSLPSTNQWEYAARAGSQDLYCYGNDKHQLHKYAWYLQNSNNSTHPVGQLLPNAFGLYDIHGNVSEQCADEYNAIEPRIFSYNDTPIKAPIISNIEHRHIYRGGSFGGYFVSSKYSEDLRSYGYASALQFPSECFCLAESSFHLGIRFIYFIFH
ncbi:MAG TPA: bifunctional serine/threonine-protein kinase/formylglycine-generating enzyme family protein [Planctomycetota bacterium]|nr:bifunctional serine/threonine-protein kinase/formylglycine-generating enzyme family protein [Planctomycetota bacterium]